MIHDIFSFRKKDTMENPDNIVNANPTEDPHPKNELEVQQPQPTKDVSTESSSANVEGAATETDIGNAAEEENMETTKMEPSDTTDDIKTNDADADDTEITDIKMEEDGEIEVKESPQVTPADAVTTTTTTDDKNNDNPLEEEETSAGNDLKDDYQSSSTKDNLAADVVVATENSTMTTTVKPDTDDGGASSEKEKVAEPAADTTTSSTTTPPPPGIDYDDEKAVAETASSNPIVKEDDDVTKNVEEKEEAVVSMEIDSSENQDTSDRGTADESQKEAPTTTTENTTAEPTSYTTTYSTRGRSSTETAAAQAVGGTVKEKKQQPERAKLHEKFQDSPRPKDPPSGVSFLVEALTEEERRTRTRFLPDVDGMHMLRKNEIKDDVALARSLPTIISPQGSVQTRTKRLEGGAGRRAKKINADSMDVDGDETIPATPDDDDDDNDDSPKTIELPYSNLVIPSDAFVAPKGVVDGETYGTITVKDAAQNEANVPSPSKVESVTSFNPPRPPESVGGKKKHRMIRWERRPEDIEVDMKNYRRTVQRTRQELQKSEDEYDRLEMIDAHLRRHFLNHTDLLNDENKNLHAEMEVEIQNLMKESDLAGSRTRSKNLTKVDVVMRDVISMLTKNQQKDVSMDDGPSNVESDSTTLFSGYGGLNSQAFVDWDNSTDFKPMKPCSSWIEPGQQVKTPYGEGTVLAVFPPESPPSTNTTGNVVGITESGQSLLSSGRAPTELQKNKSHDGKDDKDKYDSLLPLRVKVRLNYGTGTFVAASITKMESSAHFTDAKLAKRWKGMIESAVQVGPCIDLQGMLPNPDKIGKEISPVGDEGKSKVSGMDDDGDNNVKSPDVTTSSTASDSFDQFFPFGASLIPTKSGRGNFLHNMEIGDIEKTLQTALYDGHGVLGRVRCNYKVSSLYETYRIIVCSVLFYSNFSLFKLLSSRNRIQELPKM
jgi:hypothetical protein